MKNIIEHESVTICMSVLFVQRQGCSMSRPVVLTKNRGEDNREPMRIQGSGCLRELRMDREARHVSLRK